MISQNKVNTLTPTGEATTVKTNRYYHKWMLKYVIKQKFFDHNKAVSVRYTHIDFM